MHSSPVHPGAQSPVSLRTRARNAAAVVACTVLAAGPALAQSADPADALAALTNLKNTNVGFGPVLFALAAAATGILIGVKWIKRGRGAA
ncbi:hypothetical protein M4R22_15345 [Acidovorax sp. GBBC 3334]|uniref:hypothetical protein n=1 Tax=Acidovorax sp. GBBC 3334 TaxID=2940496 RepID=UPI0023034FF8|nr:hypothetical protein [Acidovorax sp. GBBC 3334]MDA8456143.1 hypothetical protein [Acidovorax sp. GBBC 3334]